MAKKHGRCPAISRFLTVAVCVGMRVRVRVHIHVRVRVHVIAVRVFSVFISSATFRILDVEAHPFIQHN